MTPQIYDLLYTTSWQANQHALISADDVEESKTILKGKVCGENYVDIKFWKVEELPFKTNKKGIIYIPK
ncbi:MAG: hypothetical protein PHU51_04730 [Candidatus Nanoarchaeia archaeon]|nr:hypothetical protein [Candidatus Nanoarchaeia archaeon]